MHASLATTSPAGNRDNHLRTGLIGTRYGWVARPLRVAEREAAAVLVRVAEHARRLRLAGLAALLGCVPPSAWADALPGKWVEVRSPHFIVVSNADPSKAREVAQHFEQIHDLFARATSQLLEDSYPPLEVFAVKGEKSMKRLLPEYWESKRRAKPAGVFFRTATSDLVAVRADLLGGRDFTTVYHEYFHFLIQAIGSRPPAWVNEGLASYWGNTHLTPEIAKVGLYNPFYIEVLRAGSLLPIEKLVSVGYSSAHYQERHKKVLLYAQSWALIHYLLLGQDAERTRPQFFDYLRLLEEGVPSSDAAARAFGDLDKLNSRLLGYIHGSKFRYLEMAAPVPPSQDKLVTRDLAEPEAAARVAFFLLAHRQPEDAAALVALATEGAQELVRTHEVAGLLHLWRGERPEARAAFERAAGLEGAGSLAHYGLAVLRFHDDRSTEGLEAVKRGLLRAIELRRDFRPAWSRLAEVYRRTGESERALASIRRALELDPEDLRNRLAAAQILLESGKEGPALKLAGDLISEALAAEDAFVANNACWSMSLAGLARAGLPGCEHAVELDPENWAFLDSRGVARALVGDFEGAVSDLSAALAKAGDEWSGGAKAQRERWVASLRAGVSPLAGDGLAALRDDVQAASVGWGY